MALLGGRAERVTVKTLVRFALVSSFFLGSPLGWASEGSPQPWLEMRREAYREVLGGRSFDVLVVPFQTEGFAIDRVGRSLMTRHLADRLTVHHGVSVAPVTLVARALGEGHRDYPWERIEELAEQLGVGAVVMGRVGHDREETLSGSIEVRARSGSGTFPGAEQAPAVSWQRIPFNDEFLPSDSFEVLLDEVMAAMPWPAVEAADHQPSRPDSIPLVPSTPSGLVAAAGEGGNVSVVWYLQTLGVLAPEGTRVREDLFERSLMAVNRLPPGTPGLALLKSRALFYLERRPAAVAALGVAGRPGETAFSAFLQADLPGVEGAVGELVGESPSLEWLILQLELNDLRVQFEKQLVPPGFEEDIVSALPEKWGDLVRLRLGVEDRWRVGSNLYVKGWMDDAFPLTGFTADALATGQTALGKSPFWGAEVDLAFAEHYRRVLVEDGQRLFSAGLGLAPEQGDYLEVLRSLGERNLDDRVYVEVRLRVVPDAALELLDTFESVLEGSPSLRRFRAQALSAKAPRSPAAMRPSLMRKAVAAATDAFLWSQGQTGHCQWAHWFLGKNAPAGGDYSSYDGDYPARWYWYAGPGGGERNVLRKDLLGPENVASLTLGDGTSNKKHKFSELDLLYTHTAFQRFSYYAEKYAYRDVEFLSRNQARFSGSPKKVALLAEKSPKDAEKIFRAEMERTPLLWVPYYELGELLIKRGEIDEAFQVMMGYQHFGADSERSLGLSHDSYDAGNLFWRLGLPEYAEPFFEFCISCSTGSGKEMNAATRLFMRRERFADAMEILKRHVQRYNMQYPLRSYIPILNLMGFEEQSWQVLESLLPKMNKSPIWGAAFATHRIEGRTDEDLLAWYSQEHVKAGAGDALGRYVLDALLVDRVPDQASVQFMETAGLGETDYARFLRGYVLLLEGEYKKASDEFADVNNERLSDRCLPYQAWGLSKFLGPKDRRRMNIAEAANPFYHWLTGAVGSGLAGNTEQAVSALESAWYEVGSKWDHPFSKPYQLVQIAHWLHQDTQAEEYRNLALKWARGYSEIRPLSSWMHALVARYTDDAAERTRAIAMVSRLDPHSVWLGEVSDADRQVAARWWEENDPFRVPPEGEDTPEKAPI